MNLRKAPDEAKRERDGNGGGGGSFSPAASSSFPATRPGPDWHAPVYSESKTVSIDLETAVRNHCVALSADFAEVGHYKVLRTQLRQIGREKTWSTIMVTSVAPGEGKTVTAINLAATFAREYNQTVLLVDADLRRQSIHRYLGYPSSSGLRDYLEERAPMNDIITWPGIEKFTVISGGRPAHESAELMGSPRMRTLVAELKSRYADRYVIFDVPPVMGGADALAFAPLVDCIILVVGVGITRRQDLAKALEMLPQEKTAGFVLNRFDRATAHRYGH